MLENAFIHTHSHTHTHTHIHSILPNEAFSEAINCRVQSLNAPLQRERRCQASVLVGLAPQIFSHAARAMDAGGEKWNE